MGEAKQPAVYIMTNRRNGRLSTGVTSGLVRRVWQHREGDVAGFSKHYACKRLIWFEMHETMEGAIQRQKRIKAGSRKKKLAPIERTNPDWHDLYEDIVRLDCRGPSALAMTTAATIVIASAAKQSGSNDGRLIRRPNWIASSPSAPRNDAPTPPLLTPVQTG